jgi:hypothetical protein
MPVVLLFVGTLAAEQHSTFAAVGAGGDPPFRGWFGLEWVQRKVITVEAADKKGGIPRRTEENPVLGRTVATLPLRLRPGRSAHTIQRRELPEELSEPAANRH